jgi:peptidoglycan-associated lipoprotein
MNRVVKGLAAVAALAALQGCSLLGLAGSSEVGSDHAEKAIDQRVARDNLPTGRDLIIGFEDKVYFDYDKATLRAEALPVLKHVAEWIEAHPDIRLRIAGHADERGTREYNLALGDRRAAAVRDYLASLGVPAARLDTVSYGKERPLVVGSDEAAWAKNRCAVPEVE